MQEFWQYKAKILEVIEADTFDLRIDLGFGISKVQRVRLLGTLANNLALGDMVHLGDSAKEFVKDILPRNTEVSIRSYKKTLFIYLVEMSQQGVDISAVILDSGVCGSWGGSKL